MRPSDILPGLTEVIPLRTLTAPEIAQAAHALLDRSANDDRKSAFLRAWTTRGETATELAACAEAFLPQALNPGVTGTWRGIPLMDCCGTGGGGLNLINISTGMMFLLAELGVPVVKHGNRGLTKKSGSADVLEALGIQIDLPPEKVGECLEEVGCAFLFAPAYHPSFAAMAPVRRALAASGHRTVFNLLGPLLNPARPSSRLVGVFAPEHVALYQEALQEMGCPNFSVVCGQDGLSGRMLGEVSAHGTTQIGSSLRDREGVSVDFLERAFQKSGPTNLDSLFVVDATESARRLVALLLGEEYGLGREMLLLNTAVASWTNGTASSLEEGLVQATEALDSGRAYACLTRWQEFQPTR